MPTKSFEVENGKLKGVWFEHVYAEYDENGRRTLKPTGEPDTFIEADDVIIAIGQDNAFPWIERDLGIEFGKGDLPVIDKVTFQSTLPRVFFGGDAALGPENIITAVAQGHQAAISIHHFCQGIDVNARLKPMTNLVHQKMGIHEWMYDNEVTADERFQVPYEDKEFSLLNRKTEVSWGLIFRPDIRKRSGVSTAMFRRCFLRRNVLNAMPVSISARLNALLLQPTGMKKI